MAALVGSLLDVTSDWVQVQAHLWALQLQAARIRSPPTEWLSIQWEVWQLLKLEKAHQLEKRACERAGIKDYSAGLPHVNTMNHSKKADKSMAFTPAVRQLVLIGGGHSHAFVLKNLGMNPIPGVQVTLITRELDTPYSGMLPGHIAGTYSRDQCHIDLMRLARFAGVQLIHAEATGIDPASQFVQLGAGRPAVHYDVLSIDIGSTPNMADVGFSDGSAPITPVKPIDSFSAAWSRILARVVSSTEPVSVVVVGGGAGGVELVLSMQARIARERQQDDGLVTFALVSRTHTVLPNHNRHTQETVTAILAERGVRVYSGSAAMGVQQGRLLLSSGETVPVTECVWCAQASAAAWLASTGLALDADGFIKVSDTLQAVAHPNIFAAGDVAAMVNAPRPKAGVFAVRQGPPLAANLRSLLSGEALVPYEPQTVFLGLITTGDSRVCVASRGAMGLRGDWLFALKDWIDRKWMAGYTTHLPFMEAQESEPPAAVRVAGPAALALFHHRAMRCGGCGAKVGATVLSNVMRRLRPLVHTRPDVLAGVTDPDDCAILAAPGPGHVLLQSVDFFRSFWPDAYVFGQIAATHALSDIFAKGAEAVSALAIAVLPPAAEEVTEETLLQMMAGACSVLRECGCALVGGHSGEGAELSLGFAVNGVALAGQVMRKTSARAGDVLVLTKALGTGIVLAAEMRGKTSGRHAAAAVQSMLQSNRAAGLVLPQHGATACTDVTGFGLAGHLLEMLRDTGCAAVVHLGSLPLLPGVEQCVAQGIFSSLFPANARLRHAVAVGADCQADARFPVLFDPQTSGGLLAAVPPDRVGACLQALQALGYPAVAIGRLAARGDDDALVQVVQPPFELEGL